MAQDRGRHSAKATPLVQFDRLIYFRFKKADYRVGRETDHLDIHVKGIKRTVIRVGCLALTSLSTDTHSPNINSAVAADINAITLLLHHLMCNA